ncbi:DUF1949 domain-containing protein, partial [Deinococcus pimensis]|uniref:DUF1949 domain-containing protein n=1 Tax=Deinococcus pimensis TaxID=309888 RepID=UPI0005EB38C6
GGSAAECLRLAARETVRPRAKVVARVGFEHVSTLYRLLGDFDPRRGDETYGERGLALHLDLLADDVERFTSALRDATRGQAEVEVV